MTSRRRRWLPAIPGVLYEYPIELMLSLGIMAVGVILILPPYPIAARLGEGWELFSIVTGVLAVVAGTTNITGLVHWWRNKRSGAEQLGLWLTSGLCSTYIYLMLYRYEDPSLSLVLLLASLAVACVLRAQGIRKEACGRRELLEATNELREEMSKHGTDADRPPESPSPDNPRG